MNRNGDAFTKAACEKYHHTFVKHGHVFRNHDNKDPNNAIGKIAASTYNEPMGRIELVIWADEKKAAPELHKLAMDGTASFSMACKVPNDRCTVCGAIRKNAMDPNMCEHVRDDLGKIASDGTAIGTFNDKPTWFDESFVNRPADRIAWDLGKVASVGCGGEPSSIEYAKMAHIHVPESVYADDVPGYERKSRLFKKLAAFERAYFECTSKGIKTASDMSFMCLSKAAATDIPDQFLDVMRSLPCTGFLKAASDAGVVFSVPVFFKYAFGRDFGSVADKMADIVNLAKNGLFSSLEKKGMRREICSDTYFDLDEYNKYELPYEFGEQLKQAFSVIEPYASARSLEHIAEDYPLGTISFVKFASGESEESVKLASAYAAYVLSSLDNVCSKRIVDENGILALSASQNLLL
jgi:hypothetical protein